MKQNGPIREYGVNGVTQESLLAIVIDRLRSFQAGPFSCRDNAIALTHCEEALMWLQRRTRERIKRAVRLWTNPGDLVLSPFMGIGSEGYESLKQGRRFVGVELKQSYWEQAIDNLRYASKMATAQGDLFAAE